MEHRLATAEKKVLIELVRLVQKRGLRGAEGGWKEFLETHDKKFGANLSDPSRRSVEDLASFLKTFTKEEDLKLFARIMQAHFNRDVVEQIKNGVPEKESPEQRLVRLTLEHPEFPLDYTFPSHTEDWVVSKLRKKSKAMRANEMIAIDCEMVLCEDGTEAVVRVCAVNRKLEVQLDKLVNPKKPVADFRTAITGVSAKDIENVTCTLADIQISMKKLLKDGIIVVGHSLNYDLQALKIDHARVIDTSLIYCYSGARRHKRVSLNNLCKAVLGYEIRKEGAPHDCLLDATAAMNLVLAIVEKGVDNTIPIVHDDVQDSDAAKKLFVHRIPQNAPSEMLHKIIPGEYTLEVKPSKNPKGRSYAALLIFNNPEDANQAFENLKGKQDKDSHGLPQKLVEFQLDTDASASLYVRKMIHDDIADPVLSKKRGSEDVQPEEASKKLKTGNTNEDQITELTSQCENHLKEIEILKQQLKEKDFQLGVQDKIITNLKKKAEVIKKDKRK